MRKRKSFRSIKSELEIALEKGDIDEDIYIDTLLELRKEIKKKRLSLEQVDYVIECLKNNKSKLSLTEIIQTIPPIFN